MDSIQEEADCEQYADDWQTCVFTTESSWWASSGVRGALSGSNTGSLVVRSIKYTFFN